jgi:translation initiation factor IF-1
MSQTITAPDDLTAFLKAGELTQKGYRRISNKYKIVARIDKEDWLDIMAKQMNCSRADFYCVNGGGVKDNWRDHYIRVYSEDKLTVGPEIYKLMKAFW